MGCELEVESDLARLRRDNEQLTEINADLEQQMAAHATDMKIIRDALDRERTESQALRQRIDRSEAQIAAQTAELARLQAQITKLTDALCSRPGT